MTQEGLEECYKGRNCPLLTLAFLLSQALRRNHMKGFRVDWSVLLNRKWAKPQATTSSICMQYLSAILPVASYGGVLHSLEEKKIYSVFLN